MTEKVGVKAFVVIPELLSWRRANTVSIGWEVALLLAPHSENGTLDQEKIASSILANFSRHAPIDVGRVIGHHAGDPLQAEVFQYDRPQVAFVAHEYEAIPHGLKSADLIDQFGPLAKPRYTWLLGW